MQIKYSEQSILDLEAIVEYISKERKQYHS